LHCYKQQLTLSKKMRTETYLTQHRLENSMNDYEREVIKINEFKSNQDISNSLKARIRKTLQKD
ncbi:hypothetical protein WA026_022109, partial [Henosepilachna vigintioctopunctata]